MPGYSPTSNVRKDWFYEPCFGTSDVLAKDWPIKGRMEKASSMPVFFQGDQPRCVMMTMMWIACWFGYDTAKVLEVGMGIPYDSDGTYPKKVMETLRKAGVFPYYYFIRKKDFNTVADALTRSPLAIGLTDWPLTPDGHHMMALLDKTDSLYSDYVCVNWNNPNRLDKVTLPYDMDFGEIIAFSEQMPSFGAELTWFGYVSNKLNELCRYLREKARKVSRKTSPS